MSEYAEYEVWYRGGAIAWFIAEDDARDTPNDPWPPSHPDDLAWWLTRAQAAINAMKEP